MYRMVPSVGSGVVPAAVGPVVLVEVTVLVGAVVVAAAVGAVVLAASLGDDVGMTVVAASLGADVGPAVVEATLGAAVEAPVPFEALKTAAQYMSVLSLTSKLKQPEAEAMTQRWPSEQSAVSSHWPHVPTPGAMMTVGAEVLVAATVGAPVAATVGAGVTVGASVGATVGAAVGPRTQYRLLSADASKLKHPDSVALTHS